MVRRNPLKMIKDVAARALRAPTSAAGAAVDVAKSAASVGRSASVQVARTALGTAAGAVTTVVGDRGLPGVAGNANSPARGSDPVNVTEELGLDPAPVTKPNPSTKAPRTKPITKIDAAADPSSVDVTPADVAEVVAGQRSVNKKSAE